MPAARCLPLLFALCAPGLARAQTSPTCEGDIGGFVVQVQETGQRAAYDCLVARDDARPVLLARLAEPGFDQSKGAERVSRALAVHLAARLDRPLLAEEARALPAPDRRLLRDAVYARRGRLSPAPEHDAVFRLFDWYQPDPSFTNAQLTELDRANLEMIDHPPPPVPPPSAPSAADAVAETAQAAPVSTADCSCAASPAPGPTALGLLGLGLLGWRRRRA